MNLTCMTVCVNYSDYLERTMYWNVGHFDEHVIVTSHRDTDTADVAYGYGIDVHKTSAFYHNDDPFNKARALNEAINTRAPDGWVLLMDADILLPLNFGEMIRKERLEPEKLYYTHRGTIYRSRIGTELELLKLEPSRRRLYSILNPGIDTMPWGYFQLVNAKCSKLAHLDNWMTTHHRNASEYDTDFMNKWPRNHHSLLPQPEYRVLHMGHGPRGKNWKGRVTEELDA